MTSETGTELTMSDFSSSKLFYYHVAQKHRRYCRLKHLIKPDCRTIIPEMELRDGLKVLDVACGNGKLLFALADILRDFEFKGIDISDSQIARCKRKNKDQKIEFILSPADHLPFKDYSFDVVTCTNAIHLFPQRVRVIDEIYRVLKPDGKLYLLDGVWKSQWRQKLDKILRQTKFIHPQKKYLSRSSILSKSYLVIETK